MDKDKHTYAVKCGNCGGNGVCTNCHGKGTTGFQNTNCHRCGGNGNCSGCSGGGWIMNQITIIQDCSQSKASSTRKGEKP